MSATAVSPPDDGTVIAASGSQRHVGAVAVLAFVAAQCLVPVFIRLQYRSVGSLVGDIFSLHFGIAAQNLDFAKSVSKGDLRFLG